MFDRLIASKSRAADRPAVPSGTVSVLVHAGVCAAAVLATLRPHRLAGLDGPPTVVSWPQPSQSESDVGDRCDPVPRPPPPPTALPPQSRNALPPLDPPTHVNPS